MKKKNILAALLTVAAVVTALGGCGKSAESNAAAKGNAEGTEGAADGEVTTIYAATSANPRPFTYIDDNGELVGQNIELIQAVFDKLPQYELKIEVTDFPSIFAGLDSGRYQLGINNFAMNDERKAKYIYTDPEMVNQYIVVANEKIDLEKIEDLTELAGYTYVGSAGNDKTTVIENYNEEHPDALINISYSDADLTTELQSVESGAYDFLIIDAPMYYGFYKPEFNLNLREYSLENVKSATYSYFIVGKGNEQLAEDINKALAEVFADGTSTEIDTRYLGADYTPGIAE
ncbi:MAG: transporter substrate-binding domain-containing protein [Roseburia sp.]